jgi:hypothetical protein
MVPEEEKRGNFVKVDSPWDTITLPRDQVRLFYPDVLWVGPEVTSTNIFRALRRIDENYDLWGHPPKLLGQLLRENLSVRARATAELPALWEDIRGVAKRLEWPLDGAVVGGGVKNFHPVTSAPGTLKLFYWRWGLPSSMESVELRSHWNVDMTKLVGDDWPNTGFLGLYANGAVEEDEEALKKVSERLARIEEEVPAALKDSFGRDQETRSRHEEGRVAPGGAPAGCVGRASAADPGRRRGG